MWGVHQVASEESRSKADQKRHAVGSVLGIALTGRQTDLGAGRHLVLEVDARTAEQLCVSVLSVWHCLDRHVDEAVIFVHARDDRSSGDQGKRALPPATGQDGPGSRQAFPVLPGCHRQKRRSLGLPRRCAIGRGLWQRAYVMRPSSRSGVVGLLSNEHGGQNAAGWTDPRAHRRLLRRHTLGGSKTVNNRPPSNPRLASSASIQ